MAARKGPTGEERTIEEEMDKSCKPTGSSRVSRTRGTGSHAAAETLKFEVIAKAGPSKVQFDADS